MTNSGSLQHPAIPELARAGNLRAIAHWLNQALVPHGMRALVGMAKPGRLKVLVEFQRFPEYEELADPLRDTLVRFVCHRIWGLNSSRIEGVRIAARFSGERSILWERAIGIATPARRQHQQQSKQLRRKIRQTAREKARLKMARTVVMSGSTVAAFICGGVIAYVKAPDQSNAVPSPASQASLKPSPRPDVVQAALESVPVLKHNQVADPTDPTVTLMFAGDVTLSDAFADTVGKDDKWAFAQMDEYRRADLAMVNLENPLTKADTKLPDKQFNFKADPDLSAKILANGGIDVVTLGNNHAMDYSGLGLKETIETLGKVGIEHVGAGQNVQEARRPQVIDVKGQRVAYLGYYGADFHAANQNTPGTNYADEARIAEDIRALRNQVDWIVVNYHWGQELATHPAEWQQQLAYFTIDQGADLVVGHHPHVLQGAEIYKGRPIAYSLGNFIFGGNSRSDYDTAVLKVALKDKQMKVEFLPVEVRKFQPKVVSGDRGNTILQQIADRSSTFKQPMKATLTLDASQPNAPEAIVPAPAARSSTPANPAVSFPSTPTTSTNPSTPTNSSTVDPTSPADSSSTTPATEPVNTAPNSRSEDFSNSPSTNPPNNFSNSSSGATSLESEPAPPNPTLSPTAPDPFTTAPNHTPFHTAPNNWDSPQNTTAPDAAPSPSSGLPTDSSSGNSSPSSGSANPAPPNSASSDADRAGTSDPFAAPDSDSFGNSDSLDAASTSPGTANDSLSTTIPTDSTTSLVNPSLSTSTSTQ